MQRGRLVLIAGLPGAGKTTLAMRLATKPGTTRFSPDDWLQALALDLWDSRRRDRIEALQWTLALDLLRLGGSAIVEWGTWGRAERDRLRLEAAAAGAQTELFWLDYPADELFRRILERNAENPPITRAQLDSWVAAFEAPTEDEMALFDHAERNPPS